MSRYTDLTKSKRIFIEKLIEFDKIHNFMGGAEYATFVDMKREGRYLTNESDWINRKLNEYKPTLIELGFEIDGKKLGKPTLNKKEQ